MVFSLMTVGVFVDQSLNTYLMCGQTGEKISEAYITINKNVLSIYVLNGPWWHEVSF